MTDAPTPQTNESSHLLDALSRALGRLADAPAVQPDESGLVSDSTCSAVFAATNAAYTHADGSKVDTLLRDAVERFDGRKKLVIRFAQQYENDQEFADVDISGMAMRRVNFIGPRATVADLDMEMRVTSAGSLIPRTTRPGEKELVRIAGGDIQAFGPNHEDEAKATRVHQRGFDETGILDQQLLLAYQMRAARRLLWGPGFVTVTPTRVFGFIFHPDDAPGWTGRLSDEKFAMPLTIVGVDEDQTPCGSVVCFSIERELKFDDEKSVVEVRYMRPLIGGKRLPDAYLDWTGVDLVVSTRGVVDGRDEVSKPAKGQVESAIDSFVRGTTP
jgi:hypothetical protein